MSDMLTPEEIDAMEKQANSVLAPFSPTVETRSAANVGSVNFADRIITVIAVPYEQPAAVPFQRDIWNEVFSRGAFTGIEKRASSVPATACLDVPATNHSGGKLIGKAQAFYPDSAEGLVTDLKISRTEIGDNTLELANDGAINVSVGFMIRNRLDEQLNRHTKERRINRAFLDHVAFVAQPAYAGAKVLAVRSQDSDSGPVSTTPNMDALLEDDILRWARENARDA